MKTIIVIPSRGGSKRIPLKSLSHIGEKSMLANTIELALGVKSVDHVFVSTDSSKIADEAIRFGAIVPGLRKAHFDEFSPVSLGTLSTVLEIENEYELSESDLVIQLMPNCPFLSKDTVNDFIAYFSSNKIESLLSCVVTDPLNRFSFEINSDKTFSYVIPNTSRDKRTQDFADMYIPTGAIWVASIGALKLHKSFYTPSMHFKPIHQLEGFDIDTLEQLEFARVIHQTRRTI